MPRPYSFQKSASSLGTRLTALPMSLAISIAILGEAEFLYDPRKYIYSRMAKMPPKI